jgi:hypothetical protein
MMQKAWGDGPCEVLCYSSLVAHAETLRITIQA